MSLNISSGIRKNKKIWEKTKSSLLARTTPYTPQFIAVSRETHSDGGFHLHALVMCKCRIYIRSADWFDIDGYHPNIEAAKSYSNVYSYICKVSDPTTYGTYKNPYSKPNNWNLNLPSTPPKNRSFKQIVHESESAEDFLERVKSNFPYEWATKLHGLEYAADKLYPKPDDPPYQPPDGESTFKIPPELLEWCKNNLCVINPHFYLVSHPEASIDQLKWIVQNTDDQIIKLFNPFRVIPDLVCKEPPFTYLEQAEQEKQHGLDPWEDTITIADSLTGPNTMKMRSLTSLMTLSGSTSTHSNQSLDSNANILSIQSMGRKRSSKEASRQLFF